MIPKVLRSVWSDFPDVVIVADEKAVKSHLAYAAAKTGNVEAAKTLASVFVDAVTLDKIRKLTEEHRTVFMPVHAIEAQGINRIPAAFSELLAGRLGLSVAKEVIQENVVSHTGATGWERIARPPEFYGKVEQGRQYVLVDDFIGQGGTLANLRGFLLSRGGTVAGAITLTGKSYSAKLALDPKTLQQLRDKHGHEIENWWQETFGYPFDRLTESEARYLLRAENADTIREKILAAGS